MDRINMNKMANVVAAREAGGEQVNIAQIKQVISIFMEELGKFDDEHVMEVVNRYRRRNE
jgi:hypothetical protein